MTAPSLGVSGRQDGGAAGRFLARVSATEPLGSLVWLTIDVPGWPGARPGQFALLQARDSRYFLGRALSIALEEGESVSFLIAPVGEGTRELCALGEGQELWVLGPLGNGFDLTALCGGRGRLVLVAGGVGAAPFPLLLARIGESEVDAVPAGIVALLGFRDSAQAEGSRPIADMATALQGRGVRCNLEVVTEDGSRGRAEKVSDALQRELRPGDRLAVCGPPAMMEAIDRICFQVQDTKAWYSLEAGMACGVGSCHGCALPLADGTMVRVCREGPVFDGSTVFGGGRKPTAVDGG